MNAKATAAPDGMSAIGGDSFLFDPPQTSFDDLRRSPSTGHQPAAGAPSGDDATSSGRHHLAQSQSFEPDAVAGSAAGAGAPPCGRPAGEVSGFYGGNQDDRSAAGSGGWNGTQHSAATWAADAWRPDAAEAATSPSVGPSPEADAHAAFVADAKGAGGGKPGGGGGGSSGLLTTYTSGDSGIDNAFEFNMRINFSGSWTAKQQAVVTWAADTWSKIITGDVNDDTDLNGNLVDDIVISVSTGRIDGSGNPLFGNVLAQTSNIVTRDPGAFDQWLPLTASIKLDSTDLKSSALAATWDDIILHEMGHALGFVGAIFSYLGLVDGSGNFDGTNATAAYGGVVPLEDGGGAGTAGSHWDETGFAPVGDGQMTNELMTGYVVPGEQTYLSDTTVGALADMGYEVADPSIVSTYMVVNSNLLVV